jgi:hypothetical protein
MNPPGINNDKLTQPGLPVSLAMDEPLKLLIKPRHLKTVKIHYPIAWIVERL